MYRKSMPKGKKRILENRIKYKSDYKAGTLSSLAKFNN